MSLQFTTGYEKFPSPQSSPLGGEDVKRSLADDKAPLSLYPSPSRGEGQG